MSADNRNLVKVGIADDDGNIETLWAEPLGGSLYRLANTPFFAYRMSFDDIVEAVPDADGLLMLRRVVHRSGNRTVRVMLSEPAEAEPGPTLFAGVKRLACTYEGAYGKLICIDVPPSVALESVTEFLTRLRVEWEYANPKYEDLFHDEGELEVE